MAGFSDYNKDTSERGAQFSILTALKLGISILAHTQTGGDCKRGGLPTGITQFQSAAQFVGDTGDSVLPILYDEFQSSPPRMGQQLNAAINIQHGTKCCANMFYEKKRLGIGKIAIFYMNPTPFFVRLRFAQELHHQINYRRCSDGLAAGKREKSIVGIHQFFLSPFSQLSIFVLYGQLTRLSMLY